MYFLPPIIYWMLCTVQQLYYTQRNGKASSRLFCSVLFVQKSIYTFGDFDQPVKSVIGRGTADVSVCEMT